MTPNEMSNEFDILYNNITSNQAPGIDEYEKSVFLTKAQEEILLAYFNPKGNKMLEGFDDSHRRQIDFSKVIMVWKQSTADQFKNANFDTRNNSKSISLPADILVILNEKVIVNRTIADINPSKTLSVVPIGYKEYDRLMSKPYKRPLKNQAWRILNYHDANTCDLVVGPSDTISSYILRYVKKPKPIILAKLDDLSINGKSEPMGCELDEILHHEILQRAVELAKAAYAGDLQSQVSLGSVSQTQIGVVPQARQQ